MNCRPTSTHRRSESRNGTERETDRETDRRDEREREETVELQAYQYP